MQRQLPEFIREDYTAFVAFIEAYYEFMRQNYDVDMLSVRDIDNTLDEFIKYFKREFAIDIPQTLIDDRFLISKIKDYYLTKGTDQSFYIMMAILFGKDVTIEYPSRQMLRASDGKWNQDVSVFAYVNAGDPAMVVGRLVDVVTATKIIRVQVDKTQNVEIEVDRVRQVAENIYEFYIDRRFFGNINVGDIVRYQNKEAGIDFSGTILPTTSSLQILATNEKIFIPCPRKNKYDNGTIHTLPIPTLFAITERTFNKRFTNSQSLIQYIAISVISSGLPRL